MERWTVRGRTQRLEGRAVTMRTRLHALFLTIMLLSTATATLAQPPTAGEDVALTEDTAWTEDGSMNGHVVVESGATLTVSANITMTDGSSITVAEGGTLDLRSGSLASEDLDAGRMVNSLPTTTVSVNFGNLSETGVVQLQFDHTIPANTLFNVTLGNTTVSAAGESNVQFNTPLEGETLTFTFTSYYFTPTYLEWVQAIHSGGTTVRVQATDLVSENAPLYWFDSGYDVVVNGQLNAVNSVLQGANISCENDCRFNNATLTGSAPVMVSNSTSIEVVDSMIAGSRTDEDIVLHDEATIVYTNTVGTGGTTDAWVRLLSERVIHTNIPGGSLDITGLGWSSSNWNDLTDNVGNVVLVSNQPTNEHKRIVQWMDGNGVEHTENATITLSITSNWGVFSTTVPAPRTAQGSINLQLPYVNVVELAPEATTATVNKSIGFMMTVENSGTADATANFRCYVDGNDADTAPSTITVSIGAGDSEVVPVTWYGYSAGDVELSCRPFLPTALDAISADVHNAEGTSMASVTWEYAEENEDAPLIIYATVVLTFVVIALGVAQARKPEHQSKSYDDPASLDVEHEDVTEENDEATDEGEEDGDEPASDE